jgi:hypothetical protein
MSNPSPDDILKAIKSSGYLMEQEVASQLESLNFHVQTNRAYEDIEEARSREIDVWAIHRQYHDQQTGFSLFVELICECKNSSNPFVFLTRKKRDIDLLVKPEEYVFPINEYDVPLKDQPNTYGVIPAFRHLELQAHNYRFQQDSRAVQFAKIVRDKNIWSANHAGLYDSIFYPLIKAFLARKKEVGRITGCIWLFFPIVFTSGKLYEIDTSGVELQAREVEYVSMLRHIKSNLIDGTFNVDFITQIGLENFIQTKIRPFANAVENRLRDAPQLFKSRKL